MDSSNRMPTPDILLQPTDRRQHERFGLDHPGRITEVDQFGNPTQTWNVRIVDLSRGGMGVRSRRMVHVGKAVLVECSTAEPGGRKLLYGMVKQSRYSEGEGYAIGVQFREVPNTAAIRNWCSARGHTI
jgi:hypothetical protein